MTTFTVMLIKVARLPVLRGAVRCVRHKLSCCHIYVLGRRGLLPNTGRSRPMCVPDRRRYARGRREHNIQLGDQDNSAPCSYVLHVEQLHKRKLLYNLIAASDLAD